MAKVKVRIAVAVGKDGHWNAAGWEGGSAEDVMAIAIDLVEDGEARYWLEAELDVPQETVVQAVVTKDGEP